MECFRAVSVFLLFIKALPSIVKHSRVLMYAYDVKLCLSYNNFESGFCLQSDIKRFQGWCQYNLLNLNYLKCNVMTFYMDTPTFMSYPLQNISVGTPTVPEGFHLFQALVHSIQIAEIFI